LPLEVVVSDDASSDGTYPLLERLIGAYSGPHRVSLRRNPTRRNVVGHIADAIPFTSGEFVVIAAGDDVSLPDRITRFADAWEQSGRHIHALNCSLQEIDERGHRGQIHHGSGKRTQSTLDDFVDHAGAFFGASAAYSRAVFERFGPLDPFNIFEDQVLPFRAALLGEAVTLDQTLVLWRRLTRSNSVQYLDRPAQARARLAKIVYQQQQQACYQRQRLADLDVFMQGKSDPALDRIKQKLQRLASTAEAAASTLQRPLPPLALLGAALRGALSFKQAIKLWVVYRVPGLSDWWYRLRTRQR